MARRAGVLLNISSLPSPYGIGVLGKGACDWVDFIAEMGFKLWQILPVVPVGLGDSPYASPSAFAGNTLYISPDALLEEGLVTEAERKAAEYPGAPYAADYRFAEENSEKLLCAAFGRADGRLLREAEAFGKANPHVANYALYRAVKDAQGGRPIWEWGEGLDYKSVAANPRRFERRALFHLFSQYLFFRQWAALKGYANRRGVRIFGDMPIYVSRDSSDLWSAPELFAVDGEALQPLSVAGVPPDYFSADGQLWGNPLYDWDAMRADGFRWWKERFDAAFGLFDVLRIDHFRAFASYWAVPAGAKSAASGRWEKGPGMELFRAVGRLKGEIVAEDLGIYGEDVVKLLRRTGFPGMRVAQFGFDPSGDSPHLPHNYVKNSVAYVGTHDNNTLLGWLWEAPPALRDFALRYCGAENEDWRRGGYRAPACRRIIEALWRSAADTVVVTFQDMCGFGADTRLNKPGTESGNWTFRATAEAMAGVDRGYFSEINRVFKRA